MLHLIFSRIGWFVLLVLLQALVFNHIHFFGYATPLPYIYFLLLLPTSTPRWAYLLLGFAMGLAIDIFSCTPGMSASAMTFSALLMSLLIAIFLPKDRDDNIFVPSPRDVGWSPYLRLAAALVFVNTFFYFVVEAFTFSDWSTTLLSALCSSLLTLLIIIALEYLRTCAK